VQTTAITNAFVVTVDPQFRCLSPGTVVFDERGIQAVGPTAETAIPRDATVIDGKGRLAVLPGLIDVHSHSSLLKGFSENAQLIDWLPEYQREHQVLTPADAYHACMISYLEALKGGTTTVLDMYRFLHEGARAAEQLGMRVHLVPYAADHPTKKFFETLASTEDLIRDHHGSAGGRVRCWVGLEHITYCSPDMFRSALALSNRYGVPIHTHTSEQREEVAAVEAIFGKRPVMKFSEYGILRPGTVLAHCVWLDERELDLLAETGTQVAHCPVSNAKLACGGPLGLSAMRERGINVGLGTDGTISNNALSQWENMKFGSLLQKNATLDAAAMPAAEALRMATIDGARVLGQQHEIGSLEVGKQADLITVDLWQPHLMPVAPAEGHEPVLWNLVYAARASDVRSVFVAGSEVVRNGRATGVDEDVVLEQVHRQTVELLERRRAVRPIPMVES
jgi:5-methylthioadenosine/S-adenosylhomocysteine deaminase